ncbi:MAG: transcriptional repressor [Tannerella sp.]|jgi:Fe2+ or Zn2+ uptake regulation protein|nr:transcriptional repressor [Tannerella sp.]
MNSISQHLSGYGIRPSVQRIAIMRYLTDNRTHPTAEEIFEIMRKQIPTLSKTTVYNTLKLFVRQGAATCIGIDEKNARFDGCVKPHAHFRCKKCGRIIDLEMDIEHQLPGNFHGTVDEAYFYIKGTCEACHEETPS